MNNKTNVKYLGVHIDHNLNWKLDIIKGKAYNKLIHNIRLVNVLTPKTKILLVNSLIMPYLNYCSTVWSSTANGSLIKLSKLHQKAHVFYNKLCLDFSKQLLYNKTILGFQIVNNIGPKYLHNKLSLVKYVHNYDTRASASFKAKATLKIDQFSKQAIRHDIAGVWNNLTGDLRNTPSIF